MAVELRRVPGAPMAQTVHIRAHDLVADGSVEEGGTDSGPSPVSYTHLRAPRD